MRGSFLPLLLCCLVADTGFDAQPLLAQQPPGLHIVVIAGQNAANILKTKSAVQPVVELLDAANRPVIGAEITFEAPDTGPGVLFLNGNRWQSLATETDGRATITGMQPVGLGPFQISVDAAYNGHFASAVIQQTNFATAGEAQTGVAVRHSTTRTGLSNRAKFAIFGGIAVAVGVGVAVALTHKSSSSNGTITPGSPTVGAPH